MKKLYLVFIVLALISITSFSFSQSLVFQEIKGLALSVPSDPDGNFIQKSFLRDDGIQELYLIGVVQGTIGCGVQIGNQRIVVIWVEKEEKYLAGTNAFGTWSEQEIDEDQANNFARHILKKIRE